MARALDFICSVFPPTTNIGVRPDFLAGEAALNSLVTVEALKYSFRRERPYQGNGSGSFFSGGTSFPSEHSAAAWSIAGVIAHEYPGTLPKLFAYGMASAVSFSRVHARQHFPSDVLVGGVLGYLVAQNIYSRRHDPEIGGGSAWESPREFVRWREEPLARVHGIALCSARQLDLPCAGAARRVRLHPNGNSRDASMDASGVCPPVG